MDAFTLDTTGAVITPHGGDPDTRETIFWSDLAPFTQGYVRAAFESANRRNGPNCLMQTRAGANMIVGFSDLAPETLAAMMKDCAAYEDGARAVGLWNNSAELGAHFWGVRQSGAYPDFPPVTLYLGEDGLIYQRVAS